jgi:phytoene desaturase
VILPIDIERLFDTTDPTLSARPVNPKSEHTYVVLCGPLAPRSRTGVRGGLGSSAVARVVVIGAGISGLATAARLADFGHQVTVCEQAATVGGRHGAMAGRGHTIDLAPGPLTLPAVFRDLFRKTGRPLERVLDLEPVDPAHRYRFADGAEIDFPHASRAGAARVLDTSVGPGAGAEWQSVIDYGGTVWDRIRSPYLDATPAWRDRARLVFPRRWRTVGGGRTLRALGYDLLADSRLRRMLEYAATGADPRRAPAELATIAYLHQTFGRWHVAGGMHRLAAAIRDRAVERGATIRTRARVTAVLAPSGRVAGVQLLNGENLAADVVVSAVDVAHLYGDLVPAGLAGSVRRRVARTRSSPALYSMHLALRGRAASGSGRPHQTVLFSADEDSELNAVFGPRPRPPADPTITVYAPADATNDSSSGHRLGEHTHVWTVTTVVPAHSEDGHRPGTIDWAVPGVADAHADLLLDRMGTLGIDVDGQIAWRIARTPRDTEAAIGASGGAAWGASLDNERALLRRPSNRSSVHGLFCVGSSAYPGPGLPLTGLSAVMVTDLIGRA